MPVEYTRLVLDIGDSDPDAFYSAIAYEKGFLFLLSLERLAWLGRNKSSRSSIHILEGLRLVV
jgi:hypothetical protein